MKSIFKSIFVAAACVGLCSPAIAQVAPRSVFSVSNVAVDVQDASSAAARRQAIDQARRIAFSALYEKMVAREDWALLPALTNAELGALVSSVDVNGEKSSPTRYAADLSVTFSREPVLALFKSLGITYTDAPTPPIVLLAAAQYGGVNMLWSGNNVWRAAWLASATRGQSLVSYDVPEKTPRTMSSVVALGLPEMPPQDLIDLIRARRASDILIANAKITLTVETGRYEAVFDIRRGPQQSAFMDFALVQNEGEGPPEMLERAIALIDRELSSLWKRQLLVEYSKAKDIRIAAVFETPEEWRRMLVATRNARRLRGVAVESVQIDRAELTARFFGDFKPLSDALAQAGVVLERETDVSWLARPLSADEQASLRIDTLSAAVEGYVDPLQDAQGEQLGDLEADVSDFETAPWELNAPQQGGGAVDKTGTGFQQGPQQ